MNVQLKSFSQEAELSDPNNIKHVLVFMVDDHKELRLPVGKETVEALMRAIYTDPDFSSQAKEEDLDEELEEKAAEAEEFGGDYVPEEDREDPEEANGYANEDEVPSL